MRIVKWVFGVPGVALIVMIALGVALFVVTDGDHVVPATVLDDPALPAIEINGVRLHAERFGDPQAETLIVLHGGPGGDYRSLLALKALSDRYQVVFYDQRGAGLSERVPAADLTLDTYLAELDGVIATFSPDRPVHLVGHSWGGMLATAYLGHAAGAIASATLIEPGFLSAPERAAWVERATRYMSGSAYLGKAIMTGFEAQHVEGPDAQAATDYLVGKMAHAFADHPDNPYHCPNEAYDAPSWRFGATASDAASKASDAEIDRLIEGAGSYRGPVLLLTGECDTWIGADLQLRHARLFARSTVTVIADAGHDVVWDNPEATLTALRAFLAR